MPELLIGELAGGGAGVARHEGTVWFVRGALPGELVEAEELRRRAGVIEARVVRVVQPGAWREAEPCPVLGVCGGCDLGHVRREVTADALRAVVRGALRHAPVVLAEAVEAAPVVVSPLGWRLRARMRWDAGSRRLGFVGPRSHQVVDIAPCRVLAPRLSAARERLVEVLARHSKPDGEVEWIENLEGTSGVAAWLGPGAPPPAPVDGVEGWHPLGRDGRVRAGGWGERSVRMSLPVPLRVPLGVFFQGNRHLTPRLFERVAAVVRDVGVGRVVDLYGGVGFLAAAARSAGVGDITVVESLRQAAAAAERNLPGARVVPCSSESWLTSPGGGAATLAILDPPREGLSHAARSGILAWKPAAVLLLSCDPAAGGRDMGVLLAAGYRLATLELWDLFAGSHHVEMLAVLVDPGR